MSYQRTESHRRLQALAIRRWRPWERSTGPRTAAGKAKSSSNVWKGGARPQLRGLVSALRKDPEALGNLTPKRDVHRGVRAELARQGEPWQHSTGPRTAAGKAKSSRNAWKGGVRPQIRRRARTLREQVAALDRLTPDRADHRLLQAELIRQWQPWQRSTGPGTAASKTKSSRNAWKGGVRPQIRSLARALREQAKGLGRLRSDGDDDD